MEELKYSEDYYNLRKEIRDKREADDLSKSQLILLEQQIKKELPQKCVKCGRENNLTLDHIIPVELLKQLGIDTTRELVEGNYQILCRMCNAYKGNRLDFATPITKQILLKIISNL